MFDRPSCRTTATDRQLDAVGGEVVRADEDFERVRIIDRPVDRHTTDQRRHGHRAHERRVLRQRVGLADELAVFQVGSLLADGVQPVIDPLQRVLGGDIVVEGAELNVGNLEQFDLITRSAKLNAKLYAKNLNIVTGRNDVQADSLQATPRAADGSEKPQLAIDSSALGGMYAGAIRCHWAMTGGYRGPDCGYTGPYFDIDGNPTDDPARDECDGCLGTGCIPRFGEGNQLPFGGFPAVSIIARS